MSSKLLTITIAFKASQTIFLLNMDHCLILTNYEYEKNPNIGGAKFFEENLGNLVKIQQAQNNLHFGWLIQNTNYNLQDTA